MKSLIDISREILSGRRVVQESGQDLKKLSVKAINDSFANDPRRGYGDIGDIKIAKFHGLEENDDGQVVYIYSCVRLDGSKTDVVVWEDEKGNIAGQTV